MRGMAMVMKDAGVDIRQRTEELEENVWDWGGELRDCCCREGASGFFKAEFRGLCFRNNGVDGMNHVSWCPFRSSRGDLNLT